MPLADEHGMVPVKPIAAHTLVLDQIRMSINLGRFRPGDRLPPERELAVMLGVSRTTVRGAVAILGAEGVLEIKRGRNGGLIVCDLSQRAGEIKYDLRSNQQELRDTFDFRVAVESAAARLAAERRTDEDLKTLDALLAKMIDLLDRDLAQPSPVLTAEFQMIDSEFHIGIAEAARSQRLVTAVREVRAAMFRPVGAVFGHLEPNANELHAQLLNAIHRQDGAAAAQAMTAHIASTMAVLDAWLQIPDKQT
jgi:GntR family transcriptional repressor for pyruvate dehydrogenase complex